MALERTYTIPLRRGWLKAPRYKRAKKAINTLKEFLVRHMKSDDVRLMPELNLEVWKHGMKNPPSRVKVNVVKDDKGVVKAQLFGVKIEEKPVEKKSVMKKITEKVTGVVKTTEKPAEAKVETPKTAAPEVKPAEPKKEVPKPAIKTETKPKPVKKVEAKTQ